MEKSGWNVELLISLHGGFLCTTQLNNSELKFSLAGNLLVTLLLAVGKQKQLKYFYLTAPALANKIITLILFCTQKHNVGFAVLACDEDKPLGKLGLASIPDRTPSPILHAGL